MNRPYPVRVIGVGGPLGDDALAWEVVRRLQPAREWGNEIEFHAIEGGQRLLDLLDGRGILLLIDALDSQTSPGKIERFEWPDPRLSAMRPGTTHHLRPVETLQLAATLGLLPSKVVIWTIAGKCFQVVTSPSDGGKNIGSEALSPAVQAAVPELVQRLIVELQALLNQRATDHA